LEQAEWHYFEDAWMKRDLQVVIVWMQRSMGEGDEVERQRDGIWVDYQGRTLAGLLEVELAE
jgi:hypothetical protein